MRFNTWPVTLTVVDGLLATPSIAFASEPGLGFFRLASGKVGLASGGSTCVTFDTNAGNYDFNGAVRPATNGSRTLGSSGLKWKGLYLDYTNTATVGAVTINKPAGRVNIASGATSVVVTNNLVTAASHVFVQASQADANNPVIRSVVPSAGSFTITISTATAADQSYDFVLINAD